MPWAKGWDGAGKDWARQPAATSYWCTLPVNLPNSSSISSLPLDFGMLPTKSRRFGTLMLIFRVFPGLISWLSSCGSRNKYARNRFRHHQILNLVWYAVGLLNAKYKKGKQKDRQKWKTSRQTLPQHIASSSSDLPTTCRSSIAVWRKVLVSCPTSWKLNNSI